MMFRMESMALGILLANAAISGSLKTAGHVGEADKYKAALTAGLQRAGFDPDMVYMWMVKHMEDSMVATKSAGPHARHDAPGREEPAAD